MQKITPCIWFDDQAEEAVKFYTSIFSNSKMGDILRYDASSSEASGQPEGSVLTIPFTLEGLEFLALNGGPIFKPTPALSFSVSCETEQEIDDLWKELSEGGFVMMELQKYDFSPKYGWLNDRFGVSWQLNMGAAEQKIRPSFMFVGKNNGQAEEAMKFYTSIFPNSKIDEVYRYEKGEGDTEGHIKHATFTLDGEHFIAMESGMNHKFTFTEGVSLMVNCRDQKEIDFFWDKMSAVPESEQCGWIKDKYGVSWQIVPIGHEEWVSTPEGMKAMMEMKKLDIATLKKAAGK